MTILVSDPGAERRRYSEEIDAALQRVLASGTFVLGPEVDKFESDFADYIGTKYAVGVANGTDAISLGLRALGIGEGDEVITVSHTAGASVAGIVQSGATPVLVDVDPVTYTLDPNALSAALSPRSRGVMPVHLYGHASNLDLIGDFCRENSLALIEDVSQAHGGRWKGQRLGSFGHISVFSCYPTKNLGALGDAGVVTTSDSAVARRIRGLRQYGWESRNFSEYPGVKLLHLDAMNERRRVLASRYSQMLVGSSIDIPVTDLDCEHANHLYVVQTDRRSDFMKALEHRGIGTGIHYPFPVHRQPGFKENVRVAGDLLATEALSSRVVSLPLHSELEPQDHTIVIEAIEAWANPQ